MRLLLIVIFLVIFRIHFYSQEKIYFDDKSFVEATIIDYRPNYLQYRLFNDSSNTKYLISKKRIEKIMYQDGRIEYLYNKSALISDTIFYKRDFFRFYITDILFQKFSFGYEKLLKPGLSFELDGFYKFPTKQSKISSLDVQTLLTVNSIGGEIRAGLSRHFYKKKIRYSIGGSIAYRQQSFSHESFFISYSGPNSIYNVSQKKKGIGGFLKLNAQKSHIELFMMLGGYATMTKNTYNSGVKTPLSHPYMKDGLALIPFLNFGVAFKVNVPKKGWYREVMRARDELKFKRKNIILYDPIQLADGCIGLNYIRINYRQALSFSNSLSVPLKNGASYFSNGILLEQSRNYQLNKKLFESSLGVNYNLFIRQQTYPFVGISMKVAQFQGDFRGNGFILNKYYGYINAGAVARLNNGLSLSACFYYGMYHNDYIKNNPTEIMKKDYVTKFYNTGKSFYLTTQLGYSF